MHISIEIEEDAQFLKYAIYLADSFINFLQNISYFIPYGNNFSC